MKTLYMSLFSVCIIILFGLSIEQAEARCIACYHSTSNGCNTEEVDRDGSNGCGCDTGCSCDGECEYDGDEEDEGEEGEAFLPGMDLNDMKVPDGGYKIQIDGDLFDDALANFVQGGQIGENETDKAWFGNKVALYELSNEEYLVFPLRENEFDLKNCNGELMATIIKN